MNKLQRHLAIILATITVAITLSGSVAALASISQGFTTDEADLPAGSLVSLELSQKNKARAATSELAPQLLGVTATQPLIELGSDSKKIQVVVSGEANVLVSDINGEVKAGDRITSSPISGVGMKAVDPTQIVGIAQSDLSDATTTTHSVTDNLGKQQSVRIGTISLQVNVSYYSGANDAISSLVPGFLVELGSSIAGKDVSPLRILFGFSFLLIGLVVAGVVLHSAVRSGIISLGRNPLAHNTLRRGMLDVLFATLGLLIVTAIVFYVILAL